MTQGKAIGRVFGGVAVATALIASLTACGDSNSLSGREESAQRFAACLDAGGSWFEDKGELIQSCTIKGDR